jgi:hypothetical protein
MSENLIIATAQVADVVVAIEGLGVAVESLEMGDAQMLTCRRNKAAISIRIAQPRDWANTPVLRDHTVAVVMVGSLLHRSEARQLREEIVAVCAPFIVAMDDMVEHARAKSRAAE